MENKDNDSFIGQQKEDFKNKYGNVFFTFVYSNKNFFLFLILNFSFNYKFSFSVKDLTSDFLQKHFFCKFLSFPRIIDLIMIFTH